MNITESKIELARKMLKLSEMKAALARIPESLLPPGEILNCQELEGEIKALGAFYASFPELTPIMVSWMVDVIGKDIIDIKGLADKFPLPEDIDDAAQVSISGYSPSQDEKIHSKITDELKKRGGLLNNVISVIEDEGFRISDSGGGCCGWHVGVPCNNADAEKLCALIHSRFKKPIEAGVIGIFKKFWEHRFPDLYNDDDARRFLEKHGG